MRRVPNNARLGIMKPLGGKAYGSIPHLPGSRRGPADHGVNEGQARICTVRARDAKDRVIVQEKLDGSCVVIARQEDMLMPLTRAGWWARTSPWDQHRMFEEWAAENRDRLMSILEDGDRLCGEWLAQAHGTRYRLPHEPFVAFDLFQGRRRMTVAEMVERVGLVFEMPLVVARAPMDPEEATRLAQRENTHGALDPIEGVVYRVERDGEVDFLAKYVRPGHRVGQFLTGAGGVETWNEWPRL